MVSPRCKSAAAPAWFPLKGETQAVCTPQRSGMTCNDLEVFPSRGFQTRGPGKERPRRAGVHLPPTVGLKHVSWSTRPKSVSVGAARVHLVPQCPKAGPPLTRGLPQGVDKTCTSCQGHHRDQVPIYTGFPRPVRPSPQVSGTPCLLLPASARCLAPQSGVGRPVSPGDWTTASPSVPLHKT